MDQFYAPKPSVGKIIAGSITALVVGILYPLLLMGQLIFPILLPCVATILIVALYGSAGLAPVISFGIAMLASSYVSFGAGLGTAAVLVCAVPTVVSVIGIRRKQRFFTQISRAVSAGMVGSVLAILLAGMMFGPDMIGQLMAQMEKAFGEMMPSLWNVQQSLFESYGLTVTYEEYATMYFDALKILQQYYELYLPGNLLTGAAMSSIIGVFWGNWLTARRGESTPESFVGLCDWYLPGNMTLGILMTLVAGLVISNMNIVGGDTAWTAVCTLSQFTFCVQGFAAMDRRQKAVGASRGRRTFLVVLLTILGMLTNNGTILSLFFLMALCGAGSALFGRKGVIREWMEKNKENMDGDGR